MSEIKIDQSRRSVYWEGRELLITPQEYRVLHCLGCSVGAVVSKQALLGAMWSTPVCSENALSTLNPAAVDLVIFRLRKKLSDDPQHPTYLETRRGFGYILYHAQVVTSATATKQLDQTAAEPPAQAVVPSLSPDSVIAPWSTLTRREWQIFLLLGDEAATRLTNRALAHQLRMTEGTLKKHLQNLYRKLDVANRSAAALLAMRVRVQLLPQKQLV